MKKLFFVIVPFILALSQFSNAENNCRKLFFNEVTAHSIIEKILKNNSPRKIFSSATQAITS